MTLCDDLMCRTVTAYERTAEFTSASCTDGFLKVTAQATVLHTVKFYTVNTVKFCKFITV